MYLPTNRGPATSSYRCLEQVTVTFLSLPGGFNLNRVECVIVGTGILETEVTR